MSYLAPSGLPYLSVSQVSTAFGPEGCPHKWATQYLKKVRSPPDSSAVLGTRVHTIAESYLKHGAQPDLSERLTLWHSKKAQHITYAPGEIFASGMHLLPERTRVTVEGQFSFCTNVHGGDPVWWRGAKDAAWYDDEGVPWIGDHKTTVSFSYQKTESKLRADYQACLYAFEAMERLKVQRVGLAWWTYITDPAKKRECRATQIYVLFPEVRDVVAELERHGRVLLSHYQEHARSRILPQLTQNRSVCSAFGGCKLRDTEHCQEQTLSDLFNEGANTVSHDDFLKDVASRFGAPPPPPVPVPPPPPVFSAPLPPPPPPPPPPVSQPWAPGQPLNDAQALLEATGAPLRAIANAADVPPSPEVAESYTSGRPAVEAGFINAPEAAGMVAPLDLDELAAQAGPAPAAAPQNAPPPDALDAMSREAIKAYGVQLGCLEENCRFQAPRMREIVRAHLKSSKLQGVDVVAPEGPVVGVPPGVEELAHAAPLVAGDPNSLTRDQSDFVVNGLEVHVDVRRPGEESADDRVRRIVREELRALLARI